MSTVLLQYTSTWLKKIKEQKCKLTNIFYLYEVAFYCITHDLTTLTPICFISNCHLTHFPLIFKNANPHHYRRTSLLSPWLISYTNDHFGSKNLAPNTSTWAYNWTGIFITNGIQEKNNLLTLNKFAFLRIIISFFRILYVSYRSVRHWHQNVGTKIWILDT